MKIVHFDFRLVLSCCAIVVFSRISNRMWILVDSSAVTIPNVAMRYVSRYLGHDAIRIAILVYRVSQCLDLHTKKNTFF